MAGSDLAPVFNIGATICGDILGLPYAQYRAASANNPIAIGNLLAEVNAWITPDKKGLASSASGYGKPIWYGLFDPTLTQVGDYLVGPLGTFFIASQSVPQPMQLISCNATVDVSTVSQSSSFGALADYGGDDRANETIIATGWPCSMLQGTKGEKGSTNLPGDVKMPWQNILLPAIPGVTLRNNNILTSADGARHIISSAELTDLGWRISAALATT